MSIFVIHIYPTIILKYSRLHTKGEVSDVATECRRHKVTKSNHWATKPEVCNQLVNQLVLCLTTQNSKIRLISSIALNFEVKVDNLVINLLLANLIGQFKLVKMHYKANHWPFDPNGGRQIEVNLPHTQVFLLPQPSPGPSPGQDSKARCLPPRGYCTVWQVASWSWRANLQQWWSRTRHLRRRRPAQLGA